MATLNEMEYLLDYLIYKATGTMVASISSINEYSDTIDKKLEYIIDNQITAFEYLSKLPDVLPDIMPDTGGKKGCDGTGFQRDRVISYLDTVIEVYKTGGIASVYVYMELHDGGTSSALNQLNVVMLLPSTNGKKQNDGFIKERYFSSYIIFNSEIFSQVFKIPLSREDPRTGEQITILSGQYYVYCDSFLIYLILHTDGMTEEKKMEKCTPTGKNFKWRNVFDRGIPVPMDSYSREETDFFKYRNQLRDKFTYKDGRVPDLTETTQLKKSNTCTKKAKLSIARLIRSKYSKSPVPGLRSKSSVDLEVLPDHTDDFFVNYTIDKILTDKEKNSASKSIIIFGRHIDSGTLIVAKAFVEYEYHKDKERLLEEFKKANEHAYRKTQADQKELNELYLSRFEDVQKNYKKLMYESQMYQGISEYAITNIVRWISTQIYKWKAFTSLNTSEALSKQITEIIRNDYFDYAPFIQPKTITFIITERRESVRHFTTVFSKKQRKHFLKNLLYQIIFTLAQMEALGYQHNDLHFGNILIDSNPNEKFILYNERKLPIEAKVLFFDWDSGVCSKCGKNPILDELCPRSGMCNTINPRFDIYQVLRLYHESLSKNNTDTINDIEYIKFTSYAGIGNFFKVDREMIRPKDAIVQLEDMRMCNYDVTTGYCTPFPDGEPKSIKKPSQLIRHTYFDDLFIED